MSWNQAWRELKILAAHHAPAHETARADTDLPLGARIGAVVKLQKTPFIRAIANGTLVRVIDDNTPTIKSISRVRLDMAGALYRYYLRSSGDDASGNYLQVYVGADGAVGEVLYCAALTSIIPQGADEQDAFTGEGGRGLGEQFYTLWRDQLDAAGFDEQVLATVLGEGDRLDYRRDCGAPGQDFVAPFRGTEVRIDDAAGHTGAEMDVWFAPYLRTIGDGTEYLLISTNIVRSVNGDSSQRAIHVDLALGIPLDVARIEIQ